MRLADMTLSENEKVIALYRGGGFVFEFAADVMLEDGDYLVVIASSR